MVASLWAAYGYAGPPKGAHLASICEHSAECPLFDDVYADTPPFRYALSLSLRHGKAEVPEWIKTKLGRSQDGKAQPERAANRVGTASPMLPLRINGRSYLLGRMSDPANAQHSIVALYDTARGFVTVHYVNEKGEAALYGDTTEILRKVVTDYLDPETPFARSVSSIDVSLPIPVTSQ